MKALRWCEWSGMTCERLRDSDHGQLFKLVPERLSEAGVPISYRRLPQHIGGSSEAPSRRMYANPTKERKHPASAMKPQAENRPADPLNDRSANIRDCLIQNPRLPADRPKLM